MNKQQDNKEYLDTMEVSFHNLRRLHGLALRALCIPVPVLSAVFIGFFIYKPDWYTDVFVVSILSLFALGQGRAFLQFRKIYRGSANSLKVINILRNFGEELDLHLLRMRLREKAPGGYMRDVIMRWISLGLRGETGGSRNILENARQRREFTDDKEMSFHVALNRMTLKLGFLGTLIGLLLTFGPMKDAILSLQEFDGEMGFVHDIVKAIEGDRLAIFSTLIATGLSLLIELFTIQVLTRLFSGFIISDSYLDDWHTMSLKPAIKMYQQGATTAPGLEEMQKQLEQKVLHFKNTVEKSMETAMATADQTEKQLALLTEMQEKLGRNLAELHEYEKEKHLSRLKELEARIGKSLKEIREYDKRRGKLLRATKRFITGDDSADFIDA